MKQLLVVNNFNNSGSIADASTVILLSFTSYFSYCITMKKSFLNLLLILILWGCSADKNMILDQNTTFNLPEGFKEVAKTQADVDIYKSFFGNKDSNTLILYKLLSGPNHLIFVGIGFETSYEEIKNEILLQAENKVIFQEFVQNKSFTILLKRDSLNTVTHYLRILDSGNKYLFSILSNENIKDTAYIKKFIENQIISK